MISAFYSELITLVTTAIYLILAAKRTFSEGSLAILSHDLKPVSQSEQNYHKRELNSNLVLVNIALLLRTLL